MAKNRIQKGEVMTWTNSTGSDVASGQVVVVGAKLCVALGLIINGAVGELAVTDVWALPKAAEAVAQGVDLYWDLDGNPVGGTAGSGCLTATVADVPAGYAFAAAAAGDATVNTKIG